MTRADVSAALLQDVETRLGITWRDPATDDRIRGWIAAGAAYLDGKAGEAQDYEADGAARTLLMEYVRYARDEAMDVFETNYRHLILALQNDLEVTRYVEQTLQADACGLAGVQ